MTETLFAVDFPSAEHKFLLLLDRKTKKGECFVITIFPTKLSIRVVIPVIVETLEDGKKRSQYFTVDTLHDDSTISSLILSVNQTQPGAHATLYLDCTSYGMVALPKTLKEMFVSMNNARLEVVSTKAIWSTYFYIFYSRISITLF